MGQVKALVTIAFALKISDEDELVELTQSLDQSLRTAIANHYTPAMHAFLEAGEDGDLVDWYGAVVTLKKPVFSEIGE